MRKVSVTEFERVWPSLPSHPLSVPRAIEWELTFPVTLSHVTQIWHVLFEFFHQLDTFYIFPPLHVATLHVLVRPQWKEKKILYSKSEYYYVEFNDKIFMQHVII